MVLPGVLLFLLIVGRKVVLLMLLCSLFTVTWETETLL
jgi:hypothetical protein